MIKLYYAPRACSLASHIALEEAGAEYEAVRVDFASNEQRGPAYRQINAKARVPTLVTEGGALTETPAILAYIARTFPQAGLASDDAFAFAQMDAFNVFLASSVHVAFAHAFRPGRFADDETAWPAMKAKAPLAVDEYLGLVETMFADGRPWVHGETYSTSDPYLLVMERWLARDGFGGPDRFEGLRGHRERMNARPAVQKILAREGERII